MEQEKLLRIVFWLVFVVFLIMLLALLLGHSPTVEQFSLGGLVVLIVDLYSRTAKIEESNKWIRASLEKIEKKLEIHRF